MSLTMPDHLRMCSSSKHRSERRWFQNRRHHHDPISKDYGVPLAVALKKPLSDFQLIAIDSGVVSGSPRIAGTRIPVYMVLDAVQYHGSLEGVRKSYPDLTLEQVKEALLYSAAVLEQPVDYESEAVAR